MKNLADNNDNIKKNKSSNNKNSNTELDRDKYRTIVLLKEQLNSIRDLLDEEEQEKNKIELPKIKEKSSEEEKIKKDIKEIEKELEHVTKEIKENEEYINSLRDSDKVNDDVSLKQEDTETSIEEKILMTAPIEKIADAITDEIVEGINSYNSDTNNSLNDLSKTKELKVDLGKTIAIKNLSDTKELDKFSLIDDINRQIDEMNEESDNNSDSEIEKDFNNKILSENKEQSIIGTRKRVFLFTGIAVLILIFTMVAIWFISGKNSNNSKIEVDYLTRFTDAMNKYYETDDIDDILFVLEEVKNNSEETKKLQAKARTICDSWVLLYLNEEVEDKDSFEKTTAKYKELLDGLYRYAIVKNDTNLVRALTEKDYNDLLIQFDDIYSDSAIFYDALEQYNNKDYNKAYYVFGKIESNNSYYEKSVYYCNLIISNIVDTIENDITKLEKNIDTLDNSGKLEVYSNIEQIIIDYNSVYSNIDLTLNDRYQELLSLYTSKVSDYTDKVLNEINSQGSVT